MELGRRSWIYLLVSLCLLQCDLVLSKCPSCTGDCKNEKLDLVFVIDGSGSICNNENFDCQNWVNILKFIEESAGYLTIAPDQDRIAVVQFGNAARVEFPLSQSLDATAVRAGVMNIKHMDEKTNTSGGLYVMRTEVMSKARPNVTRVAVVITDGVSNVDELRTIPEAQLAKDAGIRIYSIGVTELININEVRRMSSAPQIVDLSYFTISNFNLFSTVSFIQKIHGTVCKSYDTNLKVKNCIGAYTNSGCYVVTDTLLTRTEAQSNCAQIAASIGRPGMGQLVSTPSQALTEEMDWLVSTRWEKGLTQRTSKRFFIGGHRNSALFGGKDFTVWTWISKSDNEVVGPQGCFADNVATSLTDLPYVITMDDLSPANCSKHCSDRGYTIMGLQNGKLCFCGNSYGRYGRSGQCDIACPGDPTSLCGGADSSNIHVIAGAHGSWAPSQPNKFDSLNQACGALEGRDDKDTWRMGDEVCYNKFPYICELFGVSPSRCQQDNANDIVRYLSGKCVLISKDPYNQDLKKTWFEANQACIDKGGELLAIKSSYLHEQVRQTLNSDLGLIRKNNVWFWVGLLGKTWQWPSGATFGYTRWAPDEPDNFGSNCMTLEYRDSFSDFYWTDAQCDEKLPSICAIDMESPLTQTETTTVSSTVATSTAVVNTTFGGPDLGASTNVGGGLGITDIVLIVVLSLLVLFGIICGIVACCYYNKGKEKKVTPMKSDMLTANILVPYNQYYEKDTYVYQDDEYENVLYAKISDTQYSKPEYTSEPRGKYTGVVMNANKLGDDHAYISYKPRADQVDGNVMDARNSTKYGKRSKNYSTSFEVPTRGGDTYPGYAKQQSQLTSTMRSSRSTRLTSREPGKLTMSMDGTRLSVAN